MVKCPAFSPGGEYCPYCGRHVGEHGWRSYHETYDARADDAAAELDGEAVATFTAADEPQYAVWYAAVGCLPDSDGPEFIGTHDECAAYIAERVAEGVPDIGAETDFTHNLYRFFVEPWADDED